MQKDDNQLQVLVGNSYFMLAGTPLFKTNKSVDDNLQKDLQKQFLIESSVSMKDNEDLSFKIITEIAIKAMSPGINDPGTALSCIDYLTQLLALRLRYQPHEWLKDKADDSDQNITRVQIKTLGFEDLLFQIMAPFRTYCAHDILVALKLLHMHSNLLQLAPTDRSEHRSLINSAQLLSKETKQKITQESDQQRIDTLINTLI